MTIKEDIVEQPDTPFSNIERFSLWTPQDASIGQYYKRTEIDSSEYSNHMILIGGCSGTGKTTIVNELVNLNGAKVINSGNLLCQVAGVADNQRKEFFKGDMRLYEDKSFQLLIDQISNHASSPLIYDTHFTITSETLRAINEPWIPGMRIDLRQRLSVELDQRGIGLSVVLIEAGTVDELMERKQGDNSKKRSKPRELVEEEYIMTRNYAREYAVEFSNSEIPINLAYYVNKNSESMPQTIADEIQRVLIG